MMEEERRKLNPLYGIGVFILVIFVFLFVFAPLQFYLGMAGLVLTELGLLLITLLAVRLTGQSFREVFPVRLPKFGQILGTILLWAGCFLGTMICTLILMYFFPDGFLNVTDSMSTMFHSTPMLLTFLIVAVMPAICEEALHRGFILFTFRNISRDWITVLCMGLIFGIFHLDPYRFLPTALLGMGLTYIMLKSRNILLPALFHFMNNGVSCIANLVSPAEELGTETAFLLADRSYILMSIGSYLIIGFLAPILLFTGSYFLRKSSNCLPRRSDTRLAVSIIIVVFLSFTLLMVGFAILMSHMPELMELEKGIQKLSF